MTTITINGQQVPATRIDELNQTGLPSRSHEVPAMREGLTVKLSIAQILSLIEKDDFLDKLVAEDIPFDPGTGGPLSAEDVQSAIEELLDVVGAALAMRVRVDEAQAFSPVERALARLNIAAAPDTGLVNLLINGDMAINQRAFAGGALSAGIYGRDRWKAGTGGCNVSVSSGVVAHTSGPLVQIVESPGLADVTVTLSVEDLTGGDLDVGIEGVTGTITVGAGRRGVTLTVPGASTGNVTVTLTPVSGAVTYRRIQFNIGEVALPWGRRHPGVEMALCQRYYAVLPTVSGYLRGSTANNREADVPWPVRMRATPTVTGSASAGTFSVVLNSAMGAQLRSAVGNTTGSVNFSDVVADAEL